MSKDTLSLVSLVHGQAVTTSLAIADGTESQHKSVIQLVRNYRADLEEFGLLAFEMRPRSAGQHGGGDVEFALLNQEQASLVMTYMRNSEVVRAFKKRLIKAFFELAHEVKAETRNPQPSAAITLDPARYIELLEAENALLKGRPPAKLIASNAAKFGKARYWTQGEFDRLSELRQKGMGATRISRELPGRSKEAVAHMLRRLEVEVSQ